MFGEWPIDPGASEGEQGIEVDLVDILEPFDAGPGEELFAEDDFKFKRVEDSSPRLRASVR